MHSHLYGAQSTSPSPPLERIILSPYIVNPSSPVLLPPDLPCMRITALPFASLHQFAFQPYLFSHSGNPSLTLQQDDAVTSHPELQTAFHDGFPYRFDVFGASCSCWIPGDVVILLE